MGLFGFKRKEGGLMDVIRCDESSYLVWKWRPEGQLVNSTSKENSIRYGSSLRVKDGELAVFVYNQNNGVQQDYILGPCDTKINTANFPVLTSIVGAAFGGESPFQAEIYFINLSGNIQVKFAVPYFDVFDPRFKDFAVPFSVRGTITFNITDYKSFIKLNRLINFELDDFSNQIKSVASQIIKGFVANIPIENNIPVMQIERKILEIGNLITQRLKPEIEGDFGVNLKRLDISAIEPDKESEGYCSLKRVTVDVQTETTEAQSAINIKNLQDTQEMNAENMKETLRIQREEAQRSQRLQTESNFMGAHALDQQTEVLKSAAGSLGQMGNVNGGGDGGGMNPAGMMTGMMMGGAMGNQMANMMNQMGANVNGQMNTPPTIPTLQYMIAINGQQSGPFTIPQLQQMVQSGQINAQTYVWKQGMTNWELASNVPDLALLFATNTPPPVPPMP